MSYNTQKKNFEQAYKTGTDLWTTIYKNIPKVVKQFAETMKTKDIVLDIGAGRGRLARTLAEYGFRVIGLDIVKQIVDKNNEEVKLEGLGREIKFMEGSVLDIPFTDEGFAGAVDIGTMQHILKEDFGKYVKEVYRVIRKDGYFLLVALSKENSNYLSWNPKQGVNSDFEYSGTHYHFFTQEEIEEIFSPYFHIEMIKTEYLDERKNEAHVVALMKRR